MWSWWVSINSCSTSAPYTSAVFYNLNTNTLNYISVEQVKTDVMKKSFHSAHMHYLIANPSELSRPNHITVSCMCQQISQIGMIGLKNQEVTENLQVHVPPWVLLHCVHTVQLTQQYRLGGYHLPWQTICIKTINLLKILKKRKGAKKTNFGTSSLGKLFYCRWVLHVT